MSHQVFFSSTKP